MLAKMALYGTRRNRSDNPVIQRGLGMDVRGLSRLTLCSSINISKIPPTGLIVGDVSRSKRFVGIEVRQLWFGCQHHLGLPLIRTSVDHGTALDL